MNETERLQQALETCRVELDAAIWDVMYSSPADHLDRMELRQLQAQIRASHDRARRWLLFFQARCGLGRTVVPAVDESESLALLAE